MKINVLLKYVLEFIYFCIHLRNIDKVFSLTNQKYINFQIVIHLTHLYFKKTIEGKITMLREDCSEA